MKLRKYLYAILAVSLLMFTAQSCFQDLGQNPPFDFPEQPPKPTVNEQGQIFHMSFEDNYTDSESGKAATVVGNPGYAEGRVGKAYAGATNSYLTFALSDMKESLTSEFTVAFWYKLNGVPDRAGLVVVGPVDEASPEKMNNRTSGFRIFREGDASTQRVKGNVGNGTNDGWFDSPVGDINSAAPVWKYVTLTCTDGTITLYIDGEVGTTDADRTISWNDCDMMSIGSGAPRFTGWDHFSDLSLFDELRIYNRALTVDEIREIIFIETPE
ncbi:MAG: LamG domain-containing protein [Tannerella sp.]|jgi:hypothetical protein|nr:LamG domain-containing protein [Tannerella sp.]